MPKDFSINRQRYPCLLVTPDLRNNSSSGEQDLQCCCTAKRNGSERAATILREMRIGREGRLVFVFVLDFLRAVYVCGIMSLENVQQKGITAVG